MQVEEKIGDPETTFETVHPVPSIERIPIIQGTKSEPTAGVIAPRACLIGKDEPF